MPGGAYQSEQVTMELNDMLAAVRNDRIEFVTMRPQGSRRATVDRCIVVTGPPELVELSRTADTGVLGQLVAMLEDRDRAWAGEVLLAAMTRREGDVVDAFATHPDKWWDALGATSHARWSAWLAEAKGRLVWDGQERIFVEASDR